MTKVLTLQNDAQALISINATDGIGAPIALPSGGTVTSSAPAVFTAAVTPEGKVSVVPVAGATGTGLLTYDNGTLSDTASVTVTVPTIAAVSMDVADAVITGQGRLMDERDQFAMSALTGMLANSHMHSASQLVPSELATWAYQIADAMQAERAAALDAESVIELNL